jgi:hypoxanthine phosphoribosyltransferase
MIQERKELSWRQFDVAVSKMAAQVESQIKNDRSNVVIIGIPRGGLCVAVALSHAIGVPMVNNIADVKGKRVIVVDEIVDSGETLCFFVRDVLKQGGDVEMCCAWIGRTGHKELSSTILFVVDEHDTDDWFVFPWENKDE